MHGKYQVRGRSVEVELLTEKSEDGLRKNVFCEMLSWAEEEGSSHVVGGKDNRLVSQSSLQQINRVHELPQPECHSSTYEFDDHPHGGDCVAFLSSESPAESAEG